jgi:hypothetical protein
LKPHCKLAPWRLWLPASLIPGAEFGFGKSQRIGNFQFDFLHKMAQGLIEGPGFCTIEPCAGHGQAMARTLQALAVVAAGSSPRHFTTPKALRIS